MSVAAGEATVLLQFAGSLANFLLNARSVVARVPGHESAILSSTGMVKCDAIALKGLR